MCDEVVVEVAASRQRCRWSSRLWCCCLAQLSCLGSGVIDESGRGGEACTALRLSMEEGRDVTHERAEKNSLRVQRLAVWTDSAIS